MWFTQAAHNSAKITDEILIEKGGEFGKELKIDSNQFAYSRGWLYDFKSRFNISSHKFCGESEGADNHAVATGREELQQLLAQYELDDIFNFDETGVFFRLPPNSTLALNPVLGTKMAKDSVTVELLTNGSVRYRER